MNYFAKSRDSVSTNVGSIHSIFILYVLVRQFFASTHEFSRPRINMKAPSSDAGFSSALQRLTYESSRDVV